MSVAFLILILLWPATAAAQIPVLRVSPTTLIFAAAAGEVSDAQQLRIRNLGTGALRWRITASDPWIRVSPASGNGQAAVSVTVDATRIAPGRHEGRLTIDASDADDSPAYVDVMVDVKRVQPGVTPLGKAPVTAPPSAGAPVAAAPSPPAAVEPPPEASPARTPLRLERQTLPPAARRLPYSQAIPVTGGMPPYAIRLVQGRLPPGLALTSGAIVGAARVQGVYPLVLAITDSASPPATLTATLAVRVIVLLMDTALQVSPPALRLSVSRRARHSPARVSITSGRQSLEWSASADARWLHVTPSSGASPAMIEVGVEAESLAPGTYSAIITVTMEGAPNSPARIPVTVVIPR